MGWGWGQVRWGGAAPLWVPVSGLHVAVGTSSHKTCPALGVSPELLSCSGWGGGGLLVSLFLSSWGFTRNGSVLAAPPTADGGFLWLKSKRHVWKQSLVGS